MIKVALLGYLVAAPLLFALLRPRRAVLVGFIFGWLFLPMAELDIPGFPDISKSYVVSFGVLMGVIIFDFGRLLSVRPRWFDLVIVAWCVVPLVSAVVNGIGAYEGLSVSLGHMLIWGVPYYLGRAYFDDLESINELALAVVVGGLVYMPLCLWEVRMSPQLHYQIYGYHQHSFLQHIRGGGYRPMVFMQHGLMVASWMTWATLTLWWLWATGALRRLWGVGVLWLLMALFVTTLLCRSVGPAFLMMAGVALLYAMRWTRWRACLWALVLVVPLYMGVRSTDLWAGAQLVRLGEATVGPARAQSLEVRLKNESMIIDRALQRPVLGWGTGGLWRVRDDSGRDITVSDGMWVIVLGQYGLIGLCIFFLMQNLPVMRLIWTMPGRLWFDPRTAGCAALGVLTALWAVDSLLNAMVNPVYILALGAIHSAASALKAMRRAQAHALALDRDAVGTISRPAWG